MRSRAEWRQVAEVALRGVLITTLALALWRSLVPVRENEAAIRTNSDRLNSDLLRVLHEPRADRIEVAVTSTPSRTQRDALVALRHAGVRASWSGNVPSLAIEVVRDRDPAGGARIRVVGDSQTVTLVDSAGTLDTLHALPSTLDVGTIVGQVRTRGSAGNGVAVVPASSERRAVLVLGRADWESKFVMSALGETGWQVRARIPAAPGVDVRDEGLLPIDTARYDAVVVLDTSAASFAAEIARFVEQGGGLVVSGEALALAAMRGLSPASASARIPGRILLAEDTITRRDLPLTPLQSLRTDAIALERQPSGLALVARRVGNGRVLALGYDESWRWRMLGGVSGLAAHRDWWSRAVASVSPERADETPSGVDAAPRVALMQALGPPTALTTDTTVPERNRLPLWMLVLAGAAALTEIASRRFRGER